jgi:hypothetical protein
MVLLGVKDLRCTTGIQIPAYIFRLPHEPPLGSTNYVHVEVCCFLN